MKIGQVASLTRLAPSAIRYYEERGLLGEVERESGNRVYGAMALQRLGLIEVLKSASFNLDEIALLVTDKSLGRDDSRRMGRRKLDEIDDRLQKLAFARQLIALGLECTCPSFESCTCDAHAALASLWGPVGIAGASKMSGG